MFRKLQKLRYLASANQTGFPDTNHSTDSYFLQYFYVRNELWIQNDAIMCWNRTVIPKRLCTQILYLLDSAHHDAFATSSIY